jgi:anaerobic selenocysteine-containing dehydrogenase
MRKTTNTVCPRNCYSTCSFKVDVDNNKIISIEAQPLNMATSEGPCLKGLSYIERAHSRDRILFPMQKFKGEFVQISWDEALTIITNRLTDYKIMYGSNSVLFYEASGSSGLLNRVGSDFWRLYGGVTKTHGNLCWPAGLEATRLTLGENKHNTPWDLENSGLIVLWGKNPAESNIHQMVFIEAAQRKGAKLIVIDPRRTPSSERSDLFLQPVPGTDAILALAVAKLIIDDLNHDNEFIDKHVVGFNEFSNSLEKINLEEASQTCGIPLDLIKELARLIGTQKPMTLIPGFGMQRYSNGGQTIRCLLALSVITGNIGKQGACWHYANLQSYVFDKIKEPECYYPDKTNNDNSIRSIPTAQLGLKMLELKSPELKMAWVERGNPVSQNPDSNKVIEAFRNLEFVVVVDQFMTDTAMEADIILPAKSMFEQSDIIGSYWNPYVQLKQKVIDPPGEVKPETEIYYLLANKLRYSRDDIRKYIPKPDDKAIDEWLEQYLDKFDNITLNKLKEGPVLAPGLQEIAFEDYKFNTPSGKIELFSIKAELKWGVNPLPTFDIPVETLTNKNDKYPLCLMSPVTKNRIHSQFGNLDCIKMLDRYPYATLSNMDAQIRKIENDDYARVYNNRGSIEIKVKIDNSIRPGNVVIYNGYWNSEGGSPNLLSTGRETDMGHGAAFHDNMVEVEKLS